MLSHKARYALRAMVELAREPSGQVTSGELALRADAPRKFLEAILLELARRHIVTSKRGKFGGYVLTRPAVEISFAEIRLPSRTVISSYAEKNDMPPASRTTWPS